MKKSIFTLFLVFICGLCMCGCVRTESQAQEQINQTNAFRIIRQADDTGKIALSYIFPLNSQLLKEKGFSEEETNIYRFYLFTYVNALAKQNKDKNVQGATVSNCTYFTDVDGLGFSVVFDDLSAQKTFFGVSDDMQEEDSESDVKTSGFFMKKVQMQTIFPISSTKSAGDLRLICNMAISSWCRDNNISEEKRTEILKDFDSSVYIYDFATTRGELKSDIMYDDQNFHHNVFIKTYEQLDEDNQIVFFTTYPNTPIWYASALVVVIGGMVAAYVILSKKKNKRKSA